MSRFSRIIVTALAFIIAIGVLFSGAAPANAQVPPDLGPSGPTDMVATSTRVSNATGDYLKRLSKVFIYSTNGAFNALNYAKAKKRMGGSEYWVRKRRQTVGQWYYNGKRVNDISDQEQRVIVQNYWPEPLPGCPECVAVDGLFPSQKLFIDAGYRYTAAVAAQVARESRGTAGPATVSARACTGSNKKVNLGNESWDIYYDSCRTDKMKRYLGYTATACDRGFSVAGIGTVIVAAAKNIEASKGVGVAVALLSAACWVGATETSESITSAQARSSENAVVKRIRKMSYAPYPSPGRYLTSTRWDPQ